ncbi:MAG: outer membrane beta-barrel domain-containing protein [Desulfuromonadaceae bacterium]|nr:outer membrane beta-barrel domain-containing protein [Desulfuromonadaceae bacterium]
MLKKIALCLVLFCLLTSPVWAEIQPGVFTLSPMIGGYVFDDDQNLEDSFLLSLGLGYNLNKNWAVEAVFTDTDADADNASGSDTDVQTYRLDTLYHFMPDNKLVPYLAAGIGGISAEPDVGGRHDHLLANYGAGIKYFFNENVALRADVRHLLDFPEPENNLIYSAGLLFQFGAPAPAPQPVAIPAPAPAPQPEPAPVVAPADSDGDGVIDDQDKCPGTPKGVKVNADGCPPDSDGDGVYDYCDKCPNTPEGAPVDRQGCPLDSDGDGVYDYQDRCPGTPAGVSVDTGGCPTKLTLHINFCHDSNKVGPEFDSEIAKAAQCISDYPGNVVFIDGHTDSTGAAAYNQQLSEQRAAAVKNRLVEKFNIPESRMTARGFGETQPVADNKTKEGRFQNRRVDVACGATE